MSAFTRYILTTLLVTAVLMAGLAIIRFLGMDQLPNMLFGVCLAFGVLTIILYRYIVRSGEKSPARFVAAFMASVTIKLLLTAGFLGVYIYFNKDEKVFAALGTFVIYIIYTILLVRFLKPADFGGNAKPL